MIIYLLLTVIHSLTTNLTVIESGKDHGSTMPGLVIAQRFSSALKSLIDTPSQTDSVHGIQIQTIKRKRVIHVKIRTVAPVIKHLLHQFSHAQAVTKTELVILTNELSQFQSSDFIQIHVQKTIRTSDVVGIHFNSLGIMTKLSYIPRMRIFLILFHLLLSIKKFNCLVFFTGE